MNFKDFLIEERNQEVIDEYKEVLLKQQLLEVINQEGDKCVFCERKAEVPIYDENIKSTLWICEFHDSELFDNSLESKGLVVKNG
jgi:hypothetical protein